MRLEAGHGTTYLTNESSTHFPLVLGRVWSCLPASTWRCQRRVLNWENVPRHVKKLDDVNRSQTTPVALLRVERTSNTRLVSTRRAAAPFVRPLPYSSTPAVETIDSSARDSLRRAFLSDFSAGDRISLSPRVKCPETDTPSRVLSIIKSFVKQSLCLPPSVNSLRQK
jgi:hypothetical protein